MIEEREQELKDTILGFHDKYVVRFTKVDGSERTMRVSKIAQAKAAAEIAVRKEKDMTAEATESLRPKKPVDENILNVFETNEDGTGGWKKVDLRKVISLQDIE